MLRSLPVLLPRSAATSVLLSSTTDLLALLAQCSNLKDLLQTHAFMICRALDQNNFLLSKFINVCSSLGYGLYGYSVFIRKSQPDVYLYNTVIKTLSRTDSAREAVILYDQIRAAGLRSDSYSIPFVLKAVVRLSAIEVGREVHCQAVGTGLDSNLPVVTALIHMYASCGCVSDARKLFDEVHSFDVALWNAMIAGYAKIGDLDSARHVFERMRQKNVITWTTLVAGYAQMKRPNEAIAIFRRMQLEDVEADEIAILAALSACADMGALELGEWIIYYINKHELHKTVPINNALIDMYAKSGNIQKSLEVFENMQHKSIITWTTMISGLALNGLGIEALKMFSRVERDGCKPNKITFVAVLSACSHLGLVDMGSWYFNSMRSRYGIEPQTEHYGCMIDLLGRAGRLQEARELISEMPFEANGAIWGSLLAASKKHGDAELGEFALRHLLGLEPYNSGNYMLLSNIYSSLGRWNEAGKLRKVMKGTGVRKTPGVSYIDVGNEVHEFIAGDNSHTHFESMLDVLCNINEQLKDG